MKVVWKSCIDSMKEAVCMTFNKLSQGVKFQDIADLHNGLLERFSPRCIHRPLQYILVFILFHIYLLYAVVFGITKFLILHTKIKGARVFPIYSSITSYKEKVIVFLTSIFLWHWFSTSVLGISIGWQYLSTWAINFRPKITIKPQLKLVSSTDSCHSNASKVSLSMEEVDANVDVYLSPEQKELASVMNGIKTVSSTASFASDLVSSIAASVTQTDSPDSLLTWSSSVGQDSDEVDLDAEMEQANCSTEHLNLREGSNWSKQNEISEEIEHKKPRMSFRQVAKEVLTRISIGPDGVRSRIPRPEALERFKARNAIANLKLRQYFLRRNNSPDVVYSNLEGSDC
ncbi:hypothetical protein DICVIV_06018 [Dictyocaulus viviparus]|uniref:Uncharacterized protein n=1 Tax=Dictyocaulus viviparus TaxID=29172 RepID=A0A0D8XTP6_DICVI|nr:hypothetical protein DICVIV_06018 [Dictyocaulus viviparus]